MTHMLLLALLQSDWLKLFAQNRDIEGWDDTALNWLVWAVIVSVICAAVMLLMKLYKKRVARNIVEKTWGSGRTWKMIALGALLVPVGDLILWGLSRDFQNVIGIKGLAWGIVLAWLLYVAVMVASHLVSSWRNEIS